MEEIVWIRPADFDPNTVAGSIIRPDASLPAFKVINRRQVVMMFRTGNAWEVRPFTQLTLKIADSPGMTRKKDGRAGVPAQVQGNAAK